MSSRTVVVAPPTRVARGVRAILRDWSALGWLNEFCWVEVTDERPGILVGADVVGAGGVRRRNLKSVLADVPGLTAVELVVLTCLGEDDPRAVPVSAAEDLRGQLHGGLAAISATHFVAVRHGRGGWRPDVAWVGWRSLVVAPEDSWSPAEGVAPIVVDPAAPLDPVAEAEYASHVAACLAATGGLWTGAEADGSWIRTGVGGTDDVVLLRSFVRRLDASAAETAIRTRLMDLTRGVPAPLNGRRELVVVRDAGEAVRATVDQLETKYADLLRTHREELPPDVVESANWRQLLLEFLRFLRDMLFSAPVRWLATAKDVAARHAAAAAEQIVFGGADTSYVLEVAGVTSSGRRVVDLERLSRGAERIAEDVARSSNHQDYVGLTYPETAPFWKDVAQVGFGLVDGSQRVDEVRLPKAGTTIGVVPRPSAVAPQPSAVFELPAAVAAEIGTRTVAAADVQQQRRVLAVLEHDVHRPGRTNSSVKANQALRDLRAWTAGLGDVYMCRIGNILDRSIDASVRDIADIAGRFRELLAASNTEVDADSIRSTQRWVRRMLAFLVVALLVLVEAWRRDYVPAAAFVAILLLLPGLVILACARRFLRARQEEFAAYFRRRKLVNEYEVLRRNLLFAAMDLRRFVVMYRQYLTWADVLGSFLAHPYGRLREQAGEQRTPIGPLPRAVRVGRLTPEDDKVARACLSLRDTVHQVGWLHPLWERAVDSGLPHAAHVLGLRTIDREGLWSDPATPGDSPLEQLALRWATDGVDPSTGDEMWRQAVRRLGELPDESGRDLGTVVEFGRRPSAAGRQEVAGFIDALRDEADRSSVFDPGILTGPARADDLNLVERWFAVPPHGVPASATLDRVQLVIQVSPAVDADLVCLLGVDGRPGPAGTPPERIDLGHPDDVDLRRPRGTPPSVVDL